MKREVRDFDLLGSAIRVGSVSTVASRRWFAVPLFVGFVGLGIAHVPGMLHGFAEVRLGIGLIRIAHDLSGLLRLYAEQHLLQLAD